MARSVRQVHSVRPGLKQLTEVLQLGLGTGDAIQSSCVERSLVYLLNALGDDDGDVALGGLEVLVEVHAEGVHLAGQLLVPATDGQRLQALLMTGQTTLQTKVTGID